MTLRRFVEVVEAILIVFMVWFAALVWQYDPKSGSKSGTIVPNLLHAIHSRHANVVLAVLAVIAVAEIVGLVGKRRHINQAALLAGAAWWVFVAKVAFDSAPAGTAVPAYTMTAALTFCVWMARRPWGRFL